MTRIGNQAPRTTLADNDYLVGQQWGAGPSIPTGPDFRFSVATLRTLLGGLRPTRTIFIDPNPTEARPGFVFNEWDTAAAYLNVTVAAGEIWNVFVGKTVAAMTTALNIPAGSRIVFHGDGYSSSMLPGAINVTGSGEIIFNGMVAGLSVSAACNIGAVNNSALSIIFASGSSGSFVVGSHSRINAVLQTAGVTLEISYVDLSVTAGSYAGAIEYGPGCAVQTITDGENLTITYDRSIVGRSPQNPEDYATKDYVDATGGVSTNPTEPTGPTVVPGFMWMPDASLFLVRNRANDGWMEITWTPYVPGDIIGTPEGDQLGTPEGDQIGAE